MKHDLVLERLYSEFEQCYWFIDLEQSEDVERDVKICAEHYVDGLAILDSMKNKFINKYMKVVEEYKQQLLIKAGEQIAEDIDKDLLHKLTKVNKNDI